MLTFWRYGYETTSISDLTRAMGVTPPSLYAAFGDKKTLFLKAARRYVGNLETIAQAIDESPSAYEAAREMLTSGAVAFTGETTPRGCLLASATASGSAASADVQREIASIRTTIQGRLGARIARDVEAGVLPEGTDVAGLTGMVLAVTVGMSALARDGAPRNTLLAVVEAALGAWPKPI